MTTATQNHLIKNKITDHHYTNSINPTNNCKLFIFDRIFQHFFHTVTEDCVRKVHSNLSHVCIIFTSGIHYMVKQKLKMELEQ